MHSVRRFILNAAFIFQALLHVYPKSLGLFTQLYQYVSVSSFPPMKRVVGREAPTFMEARHTYVTMTSQVPTSYERFIQYPPPPIHNKEELGWSVNATQYLHLLEVLLLKNSDSISMEDRGQRGLSQDLNCKVLQQDLNCNVYLL